MKVKSVNSNQWAAWSSHVLKAVTFWMVLTILVWVTTNKLDALREFKQSLPTTVTNIDHKMRELDCLTRNIYWEAASEPFAGKVAVAQVTLNRVASGRFPNSVCGVVYQKNVIYERVVCQFSWFCEGTHRVKAIHTPLYRESEEVAKRVLFEGFRLPSMEKAMYYHADYVNPGWQLPRIEKIGRHIFYGERR